MTPTSYGYPYIHIGDDNALGMVASRKKKLERLTGVETNVRGHRCVYCIYVLHCRAYVCCICTLHCTACGCVDLPWYSHTLSHHTHTHTHYTHTHSSHPHKLSSHPHTHSSHTLSSNRFQVSKDMIGYFHTMRREVQLDVEEAGVVFKLPQPSALRSRGSLLAVEGVWKVWVRCG